jgi:hypothetical protein
MNHNVDHADDEADQELKHHRFLLDLDPNGALYVLGLKQFIAEIKCRRCV